jgi:hypothetical protein
MSIGKAPRCTECKHRDRENLAEMVCKAFPEEIPDEILLGENDHSKRFDGQEGNFVFEQDTI